MIYHIVLRQFYLSFTYKSKMAAVVFIEEN